MISSKALGPGVEEYRDNYKLLITYEKFRDSLNNYLRSHGAADLNDEQVIRHLFELTVDCHRDLHAAEKMKRVFESHDWKARAKLAKKVGTDVEKLTVWLKTQSRKDYPLTTNFVLLLLSRIRLLEAAVEDLDLHERAQNALVRNLLYSKSWKLRGSGPETGFMFALDKWLMHTLPKKTQAYRDLLIAGCLLAGRLVPQFGPKSQDGRDVLDTVAMKRSRAKKASSGEDGE